MTSFSCSLQTLSCVSAYCALAMVAPTAAISQDTASELTIELNALDPVESACRLVFVAHNGFETDITSLILEAVAFDTAGGVAQISLFDFADLPSERSRVRQFDLPGQSCDAIGSLLINGVQTCEGVEDCAVSVSSRTDVELLG